MTTVVRVRVPASSANLGPGFDCFAAALGLWLEVEVTPAERFELVTALDVPRDRSNLVVAAFERLHPADRLRFSVRSQIPMSGGLGSSAAAIVGGLLAAQALAEGDTPPGTGGDLLGLAAEIEGHGDNVAAALHGGIVVYANGAAARLEPPDGLEAVLVVPHHAVQTWPARAALPAAVPLVDAADNTAHGALLILGLERGDLELVARGLRDRLHEPYRTHLYPRSAELAATAVKLGALGATISGAGPSVLVWVERGAGSAVTASLRELAAGWAEVLPATFEARGAEVELSRS
jgi:homoserine kinase